jgi:hypothetical protein
VADVDGATIAGPTLDAGEKKSPSLVDVGPAGSQADHSATPALVPPGGRGDLAAVEALPRPVQCRHGRFHRRPGTTGQPDLNRSDVTSIRPPAATFQPEGTAADSKFSTAVFSGDAPAAPSTVEPAALVAGQISSH